MFDELKSLSIDKINNLNPIVLAFVGDAVYSLYVREKLAITSDAKTGELNKLAIKEVNAKAQAEKMKALFSYLTDEEMLIFKRARNAKKATKSKSATTYEYHLSTGFEALIGFLYLAQKNDRLTYILNFEKGNEEQ